MCLVGEAQRDGMEVRGGWSRVVTDKTWRLLSAMLLVVAGVESTHR